ncbi:MAG: hypothetical protein MUP81_02660 [Dehalococcoidia bacterium]|nr:hypothetical protein [Dehalococcoidia bacterium]
MSEHTTLNLSSEPLVSEMKITKVGFVSTLPNGNTLVHDWGFTHVDTHDGYTVGDLQKISEDFYGGMLETYRKSSSYGCWSSIQNSNLGLT